MHHKETQRQGALAGPGNAIRLVKVQPTLWADMVPANVVQTLLGTGEEGEMKDAFQSKQHPLDRISR